MIVAAYRERAIQACQRDAKPPQGANPATASWSRPLDARLVIGKSDLDVYLWQVEHHLWRARYRNPYLVLTPAHDRSAGLVCEYDVMQGASQGVV